MARESSKGRMTSRNRSGSQSALKAEAMPLQLECHVGGRSQWLTLSAVDASKKVAALVATINYEFGTSHVEGLSLHGAELSLHDTVQDVLRDGDSVQGVGALRRRDSQSTPGTEVPTSASPVVEWPCNGAPGQNLLLGDCEHSRVVESIKTEVSLEKVKPPKASLMGRKLSEMSWRERQPVSFTLSSPSCVQADADSRSVSTVGEINASLHGARTRWEIVSGTGSRWRDGEVRPPPLSSSDADTKPIVVRRASGVFALKTSQLHSYDAPGQLLTPQIKEPPLTGWPPVEMVYGEYESETLRLHPSSGVSVGRMVAAASLKGEQGEQGSGGVGGGFNDYNTLLYGGLPSGSKWKLQGPFNPAVSQQTVTAVGLPAADNHDDGELAVGGDMFEEGE